MKLKILEKAPIACLAVVGLFCIPSSAQNSGEMSRHDQTGMNSRSMNAGMSATDQRFVKEAAEGGLAEVELGQLAQEKATNPEVKKFAQRMVDDHSKANNQLKELASTKGITLPDKPAAKDEATKKRLESLSGEQFDSAYMKDMVKDHTKDVSEFQRESTSAKDPAIKNFASETLSTLQSHLKEAKNIEPKVVKGNEMKGQY
jgi:putative membrane protein